MNRIKNVFNEATDSLLNIYFTAGYPEPDSTIAVIKALQSAGADLIELGIPYSDPLADGLTIQESSSLALANGMCIERLFEQLGDFRSEVWLPVLLMGYLNPIMQYGVNNFCAKCTEVGIDGLIIPDLPLEMYEDQYQKLFETYGLDFVFLIAPETSEERIRKIDEHTTGFIYMVSSSSTTGKTQELSESQIEYFKRIRDMNLKNPRLIGFGISDKKSFDKVTEYADGAIVGSAFIKQLARDSSHDAILNFIKKIKK